MKVIGISISGIEEVKPIAVKTNSGREFYAFLHGEEGRGRWQYRIPLGFRDFPVTELGAPPPDQDYVLVDLKKEDRYGNGLYLLGEGKPDNTFLVLLSLSPGYRGGAISQVEGQCSCIANGFEAQGQAGRMGGARCPVVWVTGPCVLKWQRGGRLYGSDPDWVAIYNGTEWNIAPQEQCAVEQEVFNY